MRKPRPLAFSRLANPKPHGYGRQGLSPTQLWRGAGSPVMHCTPRRVESVLCIPMEAKITGQVSDQHTEKIRRWHEQAAAKGWSLKRLCRHRSAITTAATEIPAVNSCQACGPGAPFESARGCHSLVCTPNPDHSSWHGSARLHNGQLVMGNLRASRGRTIAVATSGSAFPMVSCALIPVICLAGDHRISWWFVLPHHELV